MTIVNPSAVAILDVERFATGKLPLATTPLSGNELMTLLQNGRNVYITLSTLLSFFVTRPITPPVDISEGGTNATTAAGARTDLGVAAVGINAFVETPGNKDYVLVYHAPYAMTLDHLDVATSAGSCTVGVKINGVSVTGMTGLAVTAVNTHAVASAANVVNVDDTITITVLAVAAAANLKLTIEAVR